LLQLRHAGVENFVDAQALRFVCDGFEQAAQLLELVQVGTGLHIRG
jgi:hypothetical protein